MYQAKASAHYTQTAKQTCGAVVAIMSTVLLGTGSTYAMSRADEWRTHVQPRVAFVVDKPVVSSKPTARLDVRTPAEHIEKIRSVLNPSVADLASLFGLSRQAIYKWLSGDSAPEPDKLTRITELSQIADAFDAAGVSRAGSLLKMKTFDGRSLLDLLKAGENCNVQVTTLISEAKAMEASYDRSGLASSKAKPTSDWQSSVSIPGAPEQA